MRLQHRDGGLRAGVGELLPGEISLDDPRLISFLASHPSSTVYHHPAWLRALSDEYGRPIIMLACENGDRQLVGAFPLMYTRGLPVPLARSSLSRSRLSSLPRTPIAGPIGARQEASRVLLRAAMERAGDGILLQIKTEGPVLNDLLEGCSGSPWRNSYITPLPEDADHLQLRNHSVRKNIRRAAELGLRARLVSLSDYLPKWYPMYLENMRRVSVPPRSLRFFRAMCRHMEPLGMMKVMIAERETGTCELIAGLVLLMHKKRVSCAFIGCPRKHFQMRPNDLIHWTAIHWAASNGFREYDFGEVPNGDTELARFKSKWNAEPRQLYRYYSQAASEQDANGASLTSSQNLAAQIWRRLPLRATAHLGNWIYSYL